MYTLTILILLIFAIFLILKFKLEIDFSHFLITTIFFSIFAWIEFQFCNTYSNIACWQFYNSAIIGYYILSIPIEDIFFAPICAVIFYIIWLKIFSIFNYINIDVDNLELKLKSKLIFITFIMVLILIALYFYCFGGKFGEYQTYRFILGSIGIALSFKTFSRLKMFSILLFIICFAWCWDIWAINTHQWCYKNFETGTISTIWNIQSSQWFIIYKAWFSTCTLYYYLSGAIFFFGITESSYKYLNTYRKRTAIH